MSMKHAPLILASLLPLLLAAPAAVAAVPPTIAFQGFLADEAGGPLDGTVNLQLSLYDVASGGTARWTETQAPVVVSRGVFSVALGAVTPFPGGLFNTGPRFLGIRVNGEAELPRTQLQATPFALRAQAADTTTAALRIERTGVPVLATQMFPHESNLVGSSPDGSTAWSLQASDFVPRSRLFLFTSGGDARLGEAISTGFPELELVADGAVARLSPEELVVLNSNGALAVDVNLTGDNAVILPADAINSVEIDDEPGLASRLNSGFTALTGTLSSVLSRTITPPADGYVLALGQCVARINHTSGTATGGAAGLSEDAVEFASAQDVNILIASGAASGAYSMPLHVNAVFGVSGGAAKTIHFAGREDSGNIELEDVSLTLLFVPTAYGTVSEALVAADDGEGSGARGPQTAAEIDAERAESQRAADDRIVRELAAMAEWKTTLEQELATIRAELEAVRSGQ